MPLVQCDPIDGPKPRHGWGRYPHSPQPLPPRPTGSTGSYWEAFRRARRFQAWICCVLTPLEDTGRKGCLLPTTRPLSNHHWPFFSHQFSNSSSIFLAFLNFSSSFHPSDARASCRLSDGYLFILTRAKRLLLRVNAGVLPLHYVA